MKKNKRILLLVAYHFPPCNTIGSYRPYYMAKHLSKLGWRVIVITPDPKLWNYIEPFYEALDLEEAADIKLIKTGHLLRGLNPSHLKTQRFPGAHLIFGCMRVIVRKLFIDRSIGWYHPALRACRGLETENIDLILATGPPIISYIIAQKLSQRLNCPYVIDYRDLWTENPMTINREPAWTKRQEQRVFDRAKGVTIISDSLGMVLSDRFGQADKIRVIHNGFDADDFERIGKTQFDEFAIVYTGRFFPPTREIAPFFLSLQKAAESSDKLAKNIKFHYYGSDGEYVDREAARLGAGSFLVNHGSVTRDEALAAVRGADLSLVVVNVLDKLSLADRGVVTGKLYESLGIGTPILLIDSPDSDAARIVTETRCGWVFPASETDELANFLITQLTSSTDLKCNKERFAWNNLAKELDSFLSGFLKS